MANPPISREVVHRLAEACSEAGEAFQSVAMHLLRDQRRLGRFVEQNAAELGARESEIALYMSAVCLRVFQGVGGRMRKVPGRDLNQATARISQAIDDLLPLDEGLPERLRAIPWRAQPHLLDEILWALYDGEPDPPGSQSDDEPGEPGAEESGESEEPAAEPAPEAESSGQPTEDPAEDPEAQDPESEGEDSAHPEPEAAGRLFLVMWALVEAMDANWRPPRDFQADPATD